MNLRLIFSPGSPFARKVRVSMAEKGVAAELATIASAYDSPELFAANPNAQAPALVLDDGSSLYDSTVICAWLDEHFPEPRLIPAGEAQWAVRRAEAAANGVMENTVRIRMESLRTGPSRSEAHIRRWIGSIRRALDQLEAQPPGGLDMGEIGLAIALDYIDFRAPEVDWRAGRPNLAARRDVMAGRPSFKATTPQ